jgi:hypothetical protein
MSRDLAPRRFPPGTLCALLAVGVCWLPASPAHAWAIGSQINETGCHEPITAAALRAVRARFDTAPVLTPSRDEAAMISDVLFAPPDDLVRDLAGMSLLLGVRDNDLKGIDPLSSLDLIQVHGNPTTQDEHCIRGPEDDGEAGNPAALAACRNFIVQTATEALDGLDASGKVDDTRRIPLTMYVAIRGKIAPALPLFYVEIGAAMHALEDGFPHTYRTDDGMKVTVVLNWIDLVGGHYDEARDGPPHRAELDRCWDSDPTIRRNYALATQAATELLSVALDPTLDRDQKIQQFAAVTDRYLTYQPGCTFDNRWCDPPEATVSNSIGCNASGAGAIALWAVWTAVGVLAAWRRRRARRRDQLGLLGATLVVMAGLTGSARADDPPPAPVPVAPAPEPPAPSPAPEATPDAATRAPREPGRDVKTPPPQEIAAVRADKELGSRWGVTAATGGSFDRPALVGSLGGRYRIREQWIVGVDAGWNPWITTSPMAMHSGVATLAGTLIWRFPMKFDRVNLRSSLHLGASMLLFDVYGAPKYSIGPYGAISLLGIDYDLGHAVRVVFDPMEIALPVPLLGQLPLYYEQFRLLIGIQVGA